MEESGQIAMKDFEVVRELGSGSFGKVKLVKKKGE
jgi:serine/threonine protein kinase